jgi:hypothetical protein
MLVPGPCFVYRQKSPLKCLLVEAAYCLLGIGSVTEFNKGESSRFAGLAVRGQRDVREGANCGEVRAQLCLSNIIWKVSNKKAHSHDRLLLR